MRTHYSYLLLLLLLGLTQSLSAQALYTIPDLHYGVEPATGFRLVRLDLAAVNADPTLTAGVVIDGTEYRFASPRATLDHEATYPVFVDGAAAGTLAFTTLPLINVTLPDSLSRTEHGPGTFTYADDSTTVSSVVGVRHRGSYSTMFPKQSLDLEFWEDAATEESRDVSFPGLREDDDWIMDAVYNEPLRVNSYVAHKLWLDMNEVPHREEEPDAKSCADVLLAEAFVDGTYTGVYLLSEQVDRKQLKLKKFRDGEIRGELYKAEHWSDATRLRGTAPLSEAEGDDWAGWEMKLPDPDDTLHWNKLFDLIDYIVNSSDEDFTNTVTERLDLDNLIDYQIFLNALRMGDNTGKNTYLARYNQETPYFYVPWDLDVSFGNRFNGENMGSFRGWLTNGLYERLNALSPDFYNSRLCRRYEELRTDLLRTDVLGQRLDAAVAYLRDNGVYAREGTVFPESLNVSPAQLDFTDWFVSNRLNWLDDQICALSTSVMSEGEAPRFTLFPNPASQRILVRWPTGARTEYAISTIGGRRVLSGTLEGPETPISLTGLPRGMYLLTLEGKSRIFVIGR